MKGIRKGGGITATDIVNIGTIEGEMNEYHE